MSKRINKPQSFDDMLNNFMKDSRMKNSEVRKRNKTKLEGRVPLYERQNTKIEK